MCGAQGSGGELLNMPMKAADIFDEAGRIVVGNLLLGVDSCKYGMLGLNPRNSNLKMQISRNAG